jgi:hypothetical protein
MVGKTINKGTLVIALAAALCGFVSTVNALTAKQLSLSPGPNFAVGVTDMNGSDFVTTNMFVGNWFGYQMAFTDATSWSTLFPQFDAGIGLLCSNNTFHSLAMETYTPVNGGLAEVAVFCGGSTTAQASVHLIAALTDTPN